MKGPTHWVRLQNGSTPECLFSKFSTSPTQFLLNTTQKYSSCILGSRLAYTGTKMMSMIATQTWQCKNKTSVLLWKTASQIKQVQDIE